MPPKSKNPQNESDGIMYVAGANQYNQLFIQSNNTNRDGLGIISPATEIPLNTSNCLSYSNYITHAATIMIDEPSTTIGPNTGNQRIKSNKTRLKKWQRITFKDDDGNIYSPISAVCGKTYTLYLLNPFKKNEAPRLVYFNEKNDDDKLVFLNTENYFPITLFGGNLNSASITKDGSILIITQNVFDTDDYTPISAKLPQDEKPVFIACLDKTIFALSSSGLIYSCDMQNFVFTKVKALSKLNIVQISGTKTHAFAITEDGEVYCLGSNKFGQLGVGKDIVSAPKFITVDSLKGYEITAAYAGGQHSLFQTSEGLILACGKNINGELLLKSGPNDKITYTPKPTTIQKNASFCIAGFGLSCIFVSCQPPSHCPNMKLENYWKKQKKSQTNISSTTKNKPNLKNKPNSDQVNSLIELKSQISKMREIIESKNTQVNQFIQNNTEILKKIEGTKEKIKKLSQLKKNKQENSKSKDDAPKKSTDRNNDKDDNDYFFNDVDNQKNDQKEFYQRPDKDQAQAKTTTKKPVVFKKQSGPLLFIRDSKKMKNTDSTQDNNFNTDTSDKTDDSNSKKDENKEDLNSISDDENEVKDTTDKTNDSNSKNDENEVNDQHPDTDDITKNENINHDSDDIDIIGNKDNKEEEEAEDNDHHFHESGDKDNTDEDKRNKIIEENHDFSNLDGNENNINKPQNSDEDEQNNDNIESTDNQKKSEEENNQNNGDDDDYYDNLSD